MAKRTAPAARITHETRDVLAGAYRAGRSEQTLLSHVIVIGDGPERVLCGKRVNVDNLVDADGMSDDELDGPASCPVCAARDPRVHDAAALAAARAPLPVEGSLARVNAALKARGVEERLVRGSGYFYFREGNAMSWPSSGVYGVWNVAALTVDQWLAEYDALVAAYEAAR